MEETIARVKSKRLNWLCTKRTFCEGVLSRKGAKAQRSLRNAFSALRLCVFAGDFSCKDASTPQPFILIVPVLLNWPCTRTLIVQIPGAKVLGSLNVIWTNPNVETGLTSSA